MSYISTLSSQAKLASKQLALLSTKQKNAVLKAMAEQLAIQKTHILSQNARDVHQAKTDDLPSAMLERLTLNEQRIDDMIQGINDIISLPDPVAQTHEVGEQKSGIHVSKMRIPLGVICMIYESRPNVTADAAALCFKSGNAVILRGGKEAIHSAVAIAKTLHDALDLFSLPHALISVVEHTERDLITELLNQTQSIDLVIPRGGEGLINFVTEHSRIPVIQHFKGVCHLYVEADADIKTALNLLENGKTQRTGVCNALECLIVDESIADTFMPQAEHLLSQHKVKMHGCQKALKYLKNAEQLHDDEFGQEYLSLEIAIKVVSNIDEALSHIARFGSQHTEVICTQNTTQAHYFQRAVDASVVMVNASSRFSDGSQLGLGAEIGIATTKLHAYGPMGLESLTCEKFLVTGTGQVRL